MTCGDWFLHLGLLMPLALVVWAALIGAIYCAWKAISHD